MSPRGPGGGRGKGGGGKRGKGRERGKGGQGGGKRDKRGRGGQGGGKRAPTSPPPDADAPAATPAPDADAPGSDARSAPEPSPAPDAVTDESLGRAAGTFTRLLVTWLWSQRMRVWRGLAGLVLLFFFARFLISLSGAALWLPDPMRHVATVLGMLVGFAAVRYGRVAFVDEEAERAGDRAAARRNAAAALGFGLAAAGLFVVFSMVMQLAVVQWDPPDWFVEDQGWLEHGIEDISDHLRMERHGGTFRGTVFVPLMYSTETQETLDLRAAQGDDPVIAMLDASPEEFLGWLEGRDAPWVSVTTAIIFALYMGVMVLATFSWGCGYSAAEELATEAAPLAFV